MEKWKLLIIVYCDYLGIMGKKTETAIVYWVLYSDDGIRMEIST